MNSHESHFPDSATGNKPGSDSTPLDGSAEATLRLIASLSPPPGLEDRIHAGLRVELRGRYRREMPKARVLEWPSTRPAGNRWLHSSFARTAAAMAIVAVVLGGAWEISSRIQPSTTAKGAPLPNRVAGPGGFSSAGAMRTPQTLRGPVVLPGSMPPPATPALVVKGKPLKKPVLQGTSAQGAPAVSSDPKSVSQTDADR